MYILNPEDSLGTSIEFLEESLYRVGILIRWIFCVTQTQTRGAILRVTENAWIGT